MKAVNLIPRDSRRSGFNPSMNSLGASHLLIGLLAVAVAMVSFYVLTNNTVNSRKAQLAGLHQQISRVQAQVTRLQSYEKFEKLAEARESTVQEIAQSRFDWHGALSDLARVVPANTTLQSLVATTSPNSGGSTGGSAGSVRGDLNSPAFSLKGCTNSQDDVAQLMSRLRVINGVSRVTLEDSAAAASGGATAASGSGSTSCKGPVFDLVVFFQPLTGEAATLAGVTTTGATTPGGTTPGGTTTGGTTTGGTK